ncbi:MAG TPA: hypothetical protein VKZ60_16710 [Chloroflexota bacterium]|nr:hypothetical protein [Chloroflexota bacterium]
MDNSLSATIVRVVGVLGDTALRMTALVVACVVVIAVSIQNSALVLPLLALGVIAALLWRPAQLLTRRLEDIAPGEAARLRQQVDVLAAQVAALQQEQRELRATVRWQQQLLERLTAPPAEPPVETAPASAAGASRPGR